MANRLLTAQEASEGMADEINKLMDEEEMTSEDRVLFLNALSEWFFRM